MKKLDELLNDVIGRDLKEMVKMFNEEADKNEALLAKIKNQSAKNIRFFPAEKELDPNDPLKTNVSITIHGTQFLNDGFIKRLNELMKDAALEYDVVYTMEKMWEESDD